jgi:hypothetical protein
MSRYYDTIAEFERDGYDIIVDRTYEDIHPRDCFDDTITDINQLCEDIDRGKYEWFMLRVRVSVEGLELAEEYLGACLYEDPQEVLTDGTAEDLIDMALTTAKGSVYRLYKKFQHLSHEVDREGVDA